MLIYFLGMQKNYHDNHMFTKKFSKFLPIVNIISLFLVTEMISY